MTAAATPPWLWPLAITVLGGLLRLHRLAAWPLVLDEGFSVGIAPQALGAIWTTVVEKDPFHPPLYFMLLHYWRALGDGDFTLRLLSAILGTLSIWILYRIGSYLFGRPIGLIAALILAVSPFHIWYSQLARMYAAVFLFSLVALDALVRLLREGRASHWLAYVAAAVLSIYTDHGALLALAAHNVAVAALYLRRAGPPLGRWVLAQAAIALLYLPWVPVLLRIVFQLGPVPVAFEERPAAAVPGAPSVLADLGFVLAAFTSWSLPEQQPLIKVAVVVIFGAIAVVGFRASREEGLAWPVLGALTVVPLAAAVVLTSKLGILFPRMLIASTAGYYLFLAAGFRAIPRRGAGALALVGLLALNTYSLNTMYYRVAKAPPWDRIAAKVSSGAQPDEAIILVHGRWQWVFRRYYAGPDVAIDGPLGPQERDRVLDLVDRHDALHLVLKEETRADPDRRISGRIRSRFNRVDRIEFSDGVVVERYVRGGSRTSP